MLQDVLRSELDDANEKSCTLCLTTTGPFSYGALVVEAAQVRI